MANPLGFIGLPNLGPGEMAIILILALLLFGKRLPEVGRSLGRGIVEFKKGVRGIEDEIDTEAVKPKAKPPLTAGGDERVSFQAHDAARDEAVSTARAAGGESPA